MADDDSLLPDDADIEYAAQALGRYLQEMGRRYEHSHGEDLKIAGIRRVLEGMMGYEVIMSPSGPDCRVTVTKA